MYLVTKITIFLTEFPIHFTSWEKEWEINLYKQIATTFLHTQPEP